MLKQASFKRIIKMRRSCHSGGNYLVNTAEQIGFLLNVNSENRSTWVLT